jgi:hypothetical protein
MEEPERVAQHLSHTSSEQEIQHFAYCSFINKVKGGQ